MAPAMLKESMARRSSSSRKLRASQLAPARGYSLFDVCFFLAALTVMAGLVLPLYLGRAKCGSQRINCTNNIKQMGLAFRQWSLDMQDRFPMQVPVTNGGTMELVNSGVAWVHFAVISNEINTPKVLYCPNEKSKDRITSTTFGSSPVVGQVPFTNDNNVTYFVGVDASQTNGSMWLSGDHNITNRVNPKHGLLSFPTNRPTGWTADLHDRQGNIGLADGSVQQYSPARLRFALAQTGVQRVRLAMP